MRHIDRRQFVKLSSWTALGVGLGLPSGIPGVIPGAEASGTPTTEPLKVRRLDGGAGTTLVSNGIPLPPGALFPDELGQARIDIAGLGEPAMSVAALGRHGDGSVRSLFVQLSLDFPTSQTVYDATLYLRQGSRAQPDIAATPVSFVDPSTNLPTDNVLNDARKAGTPSAVALPFRVPYLMSTNLAWEMESEADVLARGGAAATWESRMRPVLDMWWDKAIPMAGQPQQTLALSECRITNTSYGGNDLSNPSAGQATTTGPQPPAYYNWRVQSGAVGSAGHDYYDTAMIYFAKWCRTGDVTYFARACSYAWLYCYWAYWLIADLGGGRFAQRPQRLNHHQALPEGVGMYYLLTNDTIAAQAIRQSSSASWTNQWWVNYAGTGLAQTALGNGTQYAGEPRPMARILLSHLWAWRVGNEAEQTAAAARVVDSVNRILNGTANYLDGTWRTTAIGVCNNPATGKTDYFSAFMLAILLDALQKTANDFPQLRAQMMPHIKRTLDLLYPHTQDGLLRGSDPMPSFEQLFATPDCSVKPWPASVDLTNMYPSLFAWYGVWGTADGDPDGPIYLAKALRVLTYGVGTNAFDGVTSPFLSGQKQKSEQYCSSYRLFGLLSTGGQPGVIPEPVVSLTATPAALSVPLTNHGLVSVALRTWNHLPVTGHPVTYATDAQGVATIDAAGAVVAVAVGSATLTATCDAGSAQVPVTVTPLAFYEPFAGSALDTTVWLGTTTANSSQVVTGGLLRQTATVYNAKASVTTVNTFDFTGRSVQATYASSPIGLRVTTRLEVFDPVTLDGFRLELGSVGTVGTGVAYRVNNGTATNVGQFNYTFPAWATIRVRHNAATGNVTLERSGNVGATWSTIVTIPLSAVSVTLTAMKATLSTRGTNPGTNAVDWDDVKIY
jgi:hypothetical protein